MTGETQLQAGDPGNAISEPSPRGQGIAARQWTLPGLNLGVGAVLVKETWCVITSTSMLSIKRMLKAGLRWGGRRPRMMHRRFQWWWWGGDAGITPKEVGSWVAQKLGCCVYK